MATPTFIQEAEVTSWGTSTSPKTTGSFSVNANDVLVAIAATDDQAASISSVAGGSLTWTAQQTVNVASFCQATIWTAVVDTGKSMTVTFTKAGTGAAFFGGNVLTFRGSDGVGASNKTNGSGAPSLSLTTTQPNSAIVVINTDWNALATARTWRTGAGALTEQTYQATANYTVYGGFHADAGAAAAYTVGLTAPTGQAYAIAAVEVKGTASGGGATQQDLMLMGAGS